LGSSDDFDEFLRPKAVTLLRGFHFGVLVPTEQNQSIQRPEGNGVRATPHTFNMGEKGGGVCKVIKGSTECFVSRAVVHTACCD